jgi:hypothetical protein
MLPTILYSVQGVIGMTVDAIMDVVLSLLGLMLIWWAKPLSVRYNTWTTRLRERHPNFNPPPTPEWRERNTKIMTVLFRISAQCSWSEWRLACSPSSTD